MSNEMSRRDFLRRSGQQAVKEGVDLGTRIVPGGAVVRRLLDNQNGEGGENNGIVEPARRPWWDKLVHWKQERQGQ